MTVPRTFSCVGDLQQYLGSMAGAARRCCQSGGGPRAPTYPHRVRLCGRHRDDTGVMARATVTGTFLRKGKEKGEVSTHRISDSCDVTLPYRTHAE